MFFKPVYIVTCIRTSEQTFLRRCIHRSLPPLPPLQRCSRKLTAIIVCIVIGVVIAVAIAIVILLRIFAPSLFSSS